MAKDLTDKQLIFCTEYLKDWNGTRAAIAAGYSEDSARSMACENLTKPYIKNYINEEIHKRIDEAGIDATFILKELYECWMADVMDIIDDENGCYKPMADWPPIWRRMVSGIKIKELFQGFGADKYKTGELVEIATVKKKEFLELMGKHIGVNAFATNFNYNVSGTIKVIDETEREARVAKIMMTAMQRMKQGIPDAEPGQN